MANAGYDPRDLANMFQTIERQGGGGGGFLSDHPSPTNRYARINQEAQLLRVNTAARTDDREFFSVQERLRGYPRAQTMAEIQRNGQRYPNQGGNYPTGDRTGYPAPTVTVDGRAGYFITLNNVNEATNQPEVVNVVTTQLRNGGMFYLIQVSPNSDYGAYQGVFSNILRSLQLND